MTVKDIQRLVRSMADPQKARVLRSFFKTGPGEYAEGDIFLGVTVPQLRKAASGLDEVPLRTAQALLRSVVHEDRQLALLLFIRLFKRGDETLRRRVFRAYVDRLAHVNNWDLVDLSAPPIMGAFLHGRGNRLRRRLARDPLLWARRAAMVSTLYDIRRGTMRAALELAGMLLDDREDLIHKAVGWMLREVGDRDPSAEQQFLDRHAPMMPRTMLRVATEKFPEPRRRQVLGRG